MISINLYNFKILFDLKHNFIFQYTRSIDFNNTIRLQQKKNK
jgi:hypothetical protein